MHPAFDDSGTAKQVSPQWSAAGDAVYFVSDRLGISNIYRATSGGGDLRQVTRVAGGVSGITETSPALSVARNDDRLLFMGSPPSGRVSARAR